MHLFLDAIHASQLKFIKHTQENQCHFPIFPTSIANDFPSSSAGAEPFLAGCTTKDLAQASQQAHTTGNFNGLGGGLRRAKNEITRQITTLTPANGNPVRPPGTEPKLDPIEKPG